MENDVCVWTSMLDGRYTVVVTRTVPYHGEPTVSEGPEVLYRQSVGLMFDALFGPDICDVLDWQQMAIEFIDRRKAV